MNYTVIDFETANNKRESACALGIVKVENGIIVERKEWLIKPYDMKFYGMNIAIHGIKPEDVVNEPEFDELYLTEFVKYLENQLVIAHNASFDMSVLRKSLEHYGIDFPNFEYLCTVKIAQKVWPDLCNHKLNTLSDYFDFTFNHHDALDDCLACSNVVMKACQKMSANTPVELAKIIGLKVGTIFPNGYKPCSVSK